MIGCLSGGLAIGVEWGSDALMSALVYTGTTAGGVASGETSTNPPVTLIPCYLLCFFPPGVSFGAAVLGTVYSMPPFRLKRFPLLAAACIILVRGVIVQFYFYLNARAVLGYDDTGKPFPLSVVYASGPLPVVCRASLGRGGGVMSDLHTKPAHDQPPFISPHGSVYHCVLDCDCADEGRARHRGRSQARHQQV